MSRHTLCVQLRILIQVNFNLFTSLYFYVTYTCSVYPHTLILCTPHIIFCCLSKAEPVVAQWTVLWAHNPEAANFRPGCIKKGKVLNNC